MAVRTDAGIRTTCLSLWNNPSFGSIPREGYGLDALCVLGTEPRVGCRVVAEGVETVEIAGELAAMDGDEAQGYGFARPLSGQEIRPSPLSLAQASPTFG